MCGDRLAVGGSEGTEGEIDGGVGWEKKWGLRGEEGRGKKGEKAKKIGKEEAWRGKGEREKAAGGGPS